jgi:hypothetical protein
MSDPLFSLTPNDLPLDFFVSQIARQLVLLPFLKTYTVLFASNFYRSPLISISRMAEAHL